MDSTLDPEPVSAVSQTGASRAGVIFSPGKLMWNGRDKRVSFKVIAAILRQRFCVSWWSRCQLHKVYDST